MAIVNGIAIVRTAASNKNHVANVLDNRSLNPSLDASNTSFAVDSADEARGQAGQAGQEETEGSGGGELRKLTKWLADDHDL